MLKSTFLVRGPFPLNLLQVLNPLHPQSPDLNLRPSQKAAEANRITSYLDRSFSTRWLDSHLVAVDLALAAVNAQLAGMIFASIPLFGELEEPPQTELEAEAITVPVLLPLALDRAYDYIVPTDADVSPGDFVVVPLGHVHRIGVVWHGRTGGDKPVNPRKLKAIVEKLDVPPLPAINLAFAEWIANYTLAPVGSVLSMMMSARAVFETEEPRWGFRVGQASDSLRLTDARKRVMDAVAAGGVWAKKKLMTEAGVTAAVIDGLAAAGALIRAELPRLRALQPRPDHACPDLTADQRRAADTLQAAVGGGAFSSTLLDGVTGSGKTEVYFEAVAEALRGPGQVLILLPEIALTSQFLERFAVRFGCRPAEWHSAVSAKGRGRVWRGLAEGDVRVVAGARSALFLPFADLRLIIVDEEHDSSFKQDDRVMYQARDMAVVRASLGNIPIILSSATPSVETVVNARRKRYTHVALPSRFSGNALPKVAAVDLKAIPPDKGAWLSQPLVDGVNRALDQGEQALLFLNRRGYAPLTLCRSCGYRFLCPQCTAYLVEHRFRGRLVCHHCGFALPQPKSCPACHREGFLAASGPGIERLMEEVAERWPDRRTGVLSSDLLPTTLALREMLTTIADGGVDLIIGTQLVSKGHNFPKLSFVGIVDGDLSLATADPRAGERTFQLLHQVMGRAGRFHTEGRGLIQTHYPDHPVMKALVDGDAPAFYEAEIAMREEALYPPFGRLAALIISGKDKREAEDYARALALAAPREAGIDVLGPVEAPLAIIRGRYRQRILVKASRDVKLQVYLCDWLSRVTPPRASLKLQIDIDPYNFL